MTAELKKIVLAANILLLEESPPEPDQFQFQEITRRHHFPTVGCRSQPGLW